MIKHFIYRVRQSSSNVCTHLTQIASTSVVGLTSRFTVSQWRSLHLGAVFTARRCAKRGVCYGNFVCLTVCPQHACFVAKRL